MNKEKDKIVNLPNTLSLARLALIPVVLICLHFPGKPGSFLAALFFGIAAVTDLLDGFYARKYQIVTSLGKFLDPLADKLLISLTMIMLIPMGRIPVLIVILIIAREITITGLRGIAGIEGKVVEVVSLGKYKTVFQSVSLSGLCLHHQYFGVDFHVVGIVFLWGALVLTIWSGLMYLKAYKILFES